MQGNAGSGKPHLRRRLRGPGVPWVQEAVDPKGNIICLTDVRWQRFRGRDAPQPLEPPPHRPTRPGSTN